MIGQTIAHCWVIEKVGGGMDVVYKAEGAVIKSQFQI